MGETAKYVLRLSFTVTQINIKCFMQEAHFQKMGPKASWDPALITPAGSCRLSLSSIIYREKKIKPNGIALAILNAIYLDSNLLMVHKNY